MNKAFTKESDVQSEFMREEDPTVPGGRNYITPFGLRRLRDELQGLMTEERMRQREVARRLRFLQARLAAAEIVDPAKVRAEQVVFGATVTVRDEQDAEKRYAIVGIDEADAARGRISWTSPLAHALLGARAGECVTFTSPRGVQELEVVKIEYIALE